MYILWCIDSCNASLLLIMYSLAHHCDRTISNLVMTACNVVHQCKERVSTGWCSSCWPQLVVELGNLKTHLSALVTTYMLVNVTIQLHYMYILVVGSTNRFNYVGINLLLRDLKLANSDAFFLSLRDKLHSHLSCCYCPVHNGWPVLLTNLLQRHRKGFQVKRGSKTLILYL